MAVNLSDFAIAVVVLGIVASIGATILTNQRDAQTTSLPVVTVTNLSADAAVKESGSYLSTIFAKTVPSVCYNQTNSVVIPTANYTSSITADGRIAIAYSGPEDTVGINNTIWKCIYTRYNVSDPRWDVANKAAVGIGEYGNWFKLMIIVAVAGIILAIIFTAFKPQGGGAGSAEYGSKAPVSGGSYGGSSAPTSKY